MSFMKVRIKQHVEGNPGFVEPEIIEIQVAVNQITLFNRGFVGEDEEVVLARLSCGTLLVIEDNYSSFVNKLSVALKGSMVSK